MGVEDKEAYAWSFDVILVIFDFSTNGGIKPCKVIPLKQLHHRMFNYNCSTLERLRAPLQTAQDQGVEISIISEFKNILMGGGWGYYKFNNIF